MTGKMWIEQNEINTGVCEQTRSAARDMCSDSCQQKQKK